MALKALDVLKLLPRTNCKKCGYPTCLAFAMKLAQKQASLDQCPDVSEAARAELEGSAAPPIRLVTLADGRAKLEMGNETVMFRHEESFYHAPGIGVLVNDDLPPAAVEAKVEAISRLCFVRVGTEIRVDVVAVENASGKPEPFRRAVAAASQLGLPLVLMSSEPANIEAAMAVCADQKPLIHAARGDNWEAFAQLAKAHACPLAVWAPSLDEVSSLSESVKAAGVEDIVLDLSGESASYSLQALTASRRLALKRKARSLGYPCMVSVRAEDPFDNLGQCCTYTAKYASLVLTPFSEPELILPILTLRQNIYTDPRKPIQVEPKVYAMGAVTPESPLLVTTNFSLTYFTVAGEVEASRVPAYIGVVDTEGTSVLTAFASDKLTSENIAALLKSDGVKDLVSHRKAIIPGYIAPMSGALREESGWEVLVGPREASGIPKYLKTVWASSR